MPTATIPAGLMQQVLETPDEDFPRLVCADWLEERGDPRGEFIRCQVELARSDPEEDDEIDWDTIRYCPNCGSDDIHGTSHWCCRFCKETTSMMGCTKAECMAERKRLGDLRRRQRKLLEAHGLDWLTAAIGPIAGILCREGEMLDWLAKTFRRGFPAALTLDAATFLQHADALLWMPEQTMACPNCDGEGMVEQGRGRGPCGDCGGQWELKEDWHDRGYSPGTGRMPRPCPATAVPIEEVTLTTWPEAELRLSDWGQVPEVARLPGRQWRVFPEGDNPEERYEALLRAEWPSVKHWHLPPG